MKKLKKTKTTRKLSAKKSGDIPVTSKMLYAVRNELKHDISLLRQETKADNLKLRVELSSKIEGVRSELNNKFETLNGKFESLNSKFENLNSKFESLDNKFDNLQAEVFSRRGMIEKVLASMHRMELLFEEQNARNKYVLDGYASLNERLERVEKKVFGEVP